jgi:hypothetical protein
VNCCLSRILLRHSSRIKFDSAPLGTHIVPHFIMNLALVGLPPPWAKPTHNSLHHPWLSPSVGQIGHGPGPPREAKTKSAKLSIFLQPLIYTRACYCILIPSCWERIWQIIHNHALTDYLYRAKMSRVNFVFNFLDLCLRLIILKMTKWVYQP